MSTTSPPLAAELEAQFAVPRRVGAADAMRRHPLVVILPVLLLAALGVALGLQRTVTYTATAQDVIEALSPSAGQLPGAVQAAQDLASNESRLIKSGGVTEPLARRFGASAGAIGDHISATPVPDSTLVKIEARSSHADRAVSLANAAASSFADFVNAQTQSGAQARRILKQYEAASAAFARALAARRAVPHPSAPSSQTAVVQTSAAVDAARVRRQALATVYQNLVQSHGNAPKMVPFLEARSASSDRATVLEMYVFAGVAGGLVIGVALATLLANRRASRTRR